MRLDIHHLVTLDQGVLSRLDKIEYKLDLIISNQEAIMAADTETVFEANASPDARTRQRSTIAFPYMALDAAIELAHAIYNNVSRGECDDNQLAAWSGQSPKSSTFRVQVSAARTFGLLEGEAAGAHATGPAGERAQIQPDRGAEEQCDRLCYRIFCRHYRLCDDLAHLVDGKCRGHRRLSGHACLRVSR